MDIKFNLMTTLIQFKEQVRILHWQSNVYNRHIIYGDLYSKFDELTDDFIETYQGKYGKIKFDSNNVILKSIGEIVLNKFFDDFINVLSNELISNLNIENDTDLISIRDDMLVLINKTRYLLAMK